MATLYYAAKEVIPVPVVFFRLRIGRFVDDFLRSYATFDSACATRANHLLNEGEVIARRLT